VLHLPGDSSSHVSCNCITQILSLRLPELLENLRVNAAVPDGCNTGTASSLNDFLNLLWCLRLALDSAM
jgi:hypothetical protein